MEAKNDQFITQLLNDKWFRIQPNGVLEKVNYYRDLPLKKGQKKPIWKSVGFISSAGLKVVHYKGHYLQIKRIVWAKFLGALRSDRSVVVIDGNESNCHPANLKLRNISDIRIKSYQSGRKAANAKLTWNEAQSLKNDWNTGLYTQKKLGEKYGITQVATGLIVNNKTYKNKNNHEAE